MDPVTHMLTGACLGRAGLNRTTGLATLTLALACEGPDIDSFSYLGGSVTGLEHHRGITHSFVGAPFVAALVLAIVYGIYLFMNSNWMNSRGTKNRGTQPKLPPNWKLLYAYACLGSLLHLFQDFTNNYGVRPFAPFNPKWYSWDIVFIVDPIMLGALFLGLVLPGFMALISEEIGSRKPKFRGRAGAIFALVCVAAVIVVRDFEHRRAVTALNSRTYRNQEPVRASAFPQFLSPLAWNGVVETQDFFHMMPVDSGSGEVDPLNQAIVRFKPEEIAVTLAAKKSRLGRVYLDWAAYPLVSAEPVDGGRHLVLFEDLRFETIQSVTGHRRPPLAGYVLLGPQLRVEEMYLGFPAKAEGNGPHP